MTGGARCVATDVSPAIASDYNPLLTEFEFPPFDKIEAKHVVPGIKQILDQLVSLFANIPSIHRSIHYLFI